MAERQRLKDHFAEQSLFRRRLACVALVVLSLLGLLAGRYYVLQVVHFERYATKSDKNRIHVLPIPPTRGLIYDRRGVLLADNRPSYSLSLVKERVKDFDSTLALLSELVDISEDDVKKYRQRLKRRRRPYEAVPLRYRLTQEDLARLAVNEYRLPGVEVEAQLVRHYPLGELFVHTVGYVGRINERELRRFDEEQLERYSGTHTIGKIGLERQYETRLLGGVGYQHVETNARGRVLRVLDQTSPTPGENLYLHLDIEMQKAAAAALEGRRGAAVAIDIKTGGVLAMVSAPTYDPNLFVTGISHKDYNRLTQSKDLPLFDRAIQGEYPPGSTLKPMIALGAWHQGIIDPERTVYDPGFYQLEGDSHKYRDWKKGGHGRVNMTTAIRQSCDTYYWDLAYRWGIDAMHDFGSLFGLGQKTGIDVPNERSGIWPSRRWKKIYRGQPWYPGDSLNVGLGQGAVLATPLQLATMVATLASQGHHIVPSLVRGKPLPSRDESLANIPENRWSKIFSAMEEVIHHPRGTAYSMGKKLPYRMAGKSGTAQVVGIAQDAEYDSEALAERHRDHALFVAFAPAHNPQVAVATIVENGEGGSSVAAPVAKIVIDSFFASQSHPSIARPSEPLEEAAETTMDAEALSESDTALESTRETDRRGGA